MTYCQDFPTGHANTTLYMGHAPHPLDRGTAHKNKAAPKPSVALPVRGCSSRDPVLPSALALAVPALTKDRCSTQHRESTAAQAKTRNCAHAPLHSFPMVHITVGSTLPHNPIHQLVPLAPSLYDPAAPHQRRCGTHSHVAEALLRVLAASTSGRLVALLLGPMRHEHQEPRRQLRVGFGEYGNSMVNKAWSCGGCLEWRGRSQMLGRPAPPARGVSNAPIM